MKGARWSPRIRFPPPPPSIPEYHVSDRYQYNVSTFSKRVPTQHNFVKYEIQFYILYFRAGEIMDGIEINKAFVFC